MRNKTYHKYLKYVSSLNLAIEFKAQQQGISISAAFEDFAADFIAFVGGNPNDPDPNNQEARTAIGLMECFRERVIPILQEQQVVQIDGFLSQNHISEMQMTDQVQQWIPQQN